MTTTNYPWAMILDHCTNTEWQWEDIGNDGWALCTIAHLDGDICRAIFITNDGKTEPINTTERVWVEIFHLPNLSTTIELHSFENMGETIKNIHTFTS